MPHRMRFANSSLKSFFPWQLLGKKSGDASSPLLAASCFVDRLLARPTGFTCAHTYQVQHMLEGTANCQRRTGHLLKASQQLKHLHSCQHQI